MTTATASHTETPWRVDDFKENGGYDCMTGAIKVGPFELDGADYGQEACQPITQDVLARMMLDARLAAASVNSYGKHCGPRAVECAEADLLGEALAVVKDSTCYCEDEDGDGDAVVCERCRVLAKAGGGA